MENAKILSLAKRRGFLWPSAEIYGGLAGLYDYGHHGAKLKRKWEDLWLRYFIDSEDNYYLIDSTNVLPEGVWKSSGHLELFTDILVKCVKCGTSYRADHLIEDKLCRTVEDLSIEEVEASIKHLNIVCPKCKGSLGTPVKFNMMFPVSVGPEGKEIAYLRPETAQGAYLNFKQEFEVSRRKLPLGLAIIGRAFRNEISPRQGVYRLRELIQAELQIFFDLEKFDEMLNFDAVKDYKLQIQFVEDRDKNEMSSIDCESIVKNKGLPKFFVYHMAKIQRFYLESLGLPSKKFRFYEKSEKERAFYNKLHFDIELFLESLGGFREVAGIHYRTDYDLSRHQKGSNQSMEVNIDGKKFIPHVLELSFGIDRNLWALLDILYVTEGERTILKLIPKISPEAVGIFPLVNKDGLPEKAITIHNDLKTEFDSFYDDAGSIGRRYARMDEIGTPYCVTIDYQSLEDETVTLRDRDSTKQVRVKVGDLKNFISKLISQRAKFE